jgi:transketolase
MAIAQKWLARCCNRPGFDIFAYDIYAVCGDGCLMEGIGPEAASLTGHLVTAAVKARLTKTPASQERAKG